jgi:hypothetical protein
MARGEDEGRTWGSEERERRPGEILRDARYHRAALEADPTASHLVKAVVFELDEWIRLLELEVLGATGSSRRMTARSRALPLSQPEASP